MIMWFHNMDALRSLGIVMAACGAAYGAAVYVAGTVTQTNRPADEAFSEGYEAGYDKGWRDAQPRAQIVSLSQKRAAVGSS